MLRSSEKERLIRFGQALINQDKAKVIVKPMESKSGYWFGGGNMVEDKNGDLYLVGRYRNYGDSREGLAQGERGWQLVISKSSDGGNNFEKLVAFSKADLDVADRPVYSIESSHLHFTNDEVELFVSTEKGNIPYPDGLKEFLKPGAGVWTIEQLKAYSIEGLSCAPVETILEGRDPRWLHVKDPFVYEQDNGDLLLGFVSHPFNWTSSNAGYTIRKAGDESFSPPVFDFFPRGCTWDVAMSRITAWLRVPQVGIFAERPAMTLIFYDGGESVHDLDQHEQGIKRPRGYSCEELGGLAVADGDGIHNIERLSVNMPMFISPMGTGTSRYVDVLETAAGYYATWQQSQENFSQPLVMNFLSRTEAEEILS
jgi:hypothetical protein